MKLSDGEKLIIFMLADLYKKTGAKGEIDPNFISKAIVYDQEWALSMEYQNLNIQGTPMPKHVKDVMNYLDMWDFLETSHAALSAADKKRLETEADPFGKNVQFPGFDGNGESEYYGTAKFLVEDMGKWSRFEGRSLNSHSSSVEMHERVYEVFEPIAIKSDGNPLSVDDLITILKARVHPSHR